MSFRFRKSIKLAPGIRWNISGSGSSWTFGSPGASINVGKHGTYLNAGIPGTGLSFRTRLTKNSTKHTLLQPILKSLPEPSPVEITAVSMICGIADNGSLYFHDAEGNPISANIEEIAKKQNEIAIQSLIKRACNEINNKIEALGEIHLTCPNPRIRPHFIASYFTLERPKVPTPKLLKLFDRLFESRRLKIEKDNLTAYLNFQQANVEWQQEKCQFDKKMVARKKIIEDLIYQDVATMEVFLEERLQCISWPRETSVSFEIMEVGRIIVIDVDLPEIDDMPKQIASVGVRTLKVSFKDLSVARIQQIYSQHVHGVVFRLVGEVYSALPKVQEVVVSGYSQRRSSATGQLSDEYLISVKTNRTAWEELDFDHLTAIDVTESLARYDFRRDQLKSGIFRLITPHSYSSSNSRV